MWDIVTKFVGSPHLFGVAAFVVAALALLVNYFSWRERDLLGMRPVIVFAYEDKGWSVHNVGAAAAMDVVFLRLAGDQIYQEVRLPALAKDARLFLHFCKHDNVHRFAATYRDIEGRCYTSESCNDVSAQRRGFAWKRTKKAFVPWWQLAESDT